MKTYDYSVALIAVTDTEIGAVKKMYADWKPLQIPGDKQEYHETVFTCKESEEQQKIVWARQKEMGMTAAAALSMKIIEQFRPRYLIMVGIAAGVSYKRQREQLYGDVIAADMIWNYASGKFVSPEKAEIQYGNVGFISRPSVITMDPEIKGYIEKAAKSPENQCYLHIGPMACGTAVVANSEVLAKQVHSKYEGTAGLDMESYGVAYAAENASEPRPKAIILKSICDMADSEKSDQYQKFAAYTSCEFAKLLYENFLPMHDMEK